MAIESTDDAAPTRPPDTAPDALPEPPLLDQGHALLLDFDGTLVGIAPRPDAVRVDPRLPALLQALQARLGGAFAIITGRLLQDVDQRLAPLRFLGAGLHGAQLRLDPADPANVPRDEQMAWIARDLAMRLRDHVNVLIEDKGRSIAVHFRQAPEAEAACRAAVAQAIEGIPTLEMIEGHCLFEARRRGASKEHAVDTLCEHPWFSGRMPVVLGDDRTDEDAFRAADRRGGIGVRV
ncbi:MAG TPA: trehalose-phosphatase, partial [Nevskiaceae bacterium]|nr:trehalose-phosphatase [Nevskiaceae bacterium]